MGIEIPGAVRWVADKVGTDWPDADETAMQRCADYWDNASTAIESLNGLSDATVRGLLDSIEGDVNTAIATLWQRIGGDAGAIRELMQTCDALAGMLDEAAQDVRRAKLAIIANLVTLAASLVAAAATIWAAGAGVAAAAAATLATRTAIQLILRELLANMLRLIAAEGVEAVGKNIALSAVVGAGLKGSTEAGLQVFEKARGLREGYDYGNVAQAAGNGAVSGAVAGVSKGAMRGELPIKVESELSPRASLLDKAKDFGERAAAGYVIEQVRPTTHIASKIGESVGDATVGEPVGGAGERLEAAFDGPLDIPSFTPEPEY